MVTTDIIIQAMNSVANESKIDEVEEAEYGVRQQPTKDAEAGEEITEVAPESPAEHQEEIRPSVVNSAEHDAEEEKIESDIVEIVELSVTTKSGRNVVLPSRYLKVTRISREDWKMEALTIEINAELKMLFKDLKALRYISRAEIKEGTKILKSHMFVVEKYLANGEFDKMKARLVADGRDEDAAL
jgi:hypothetical protein